MSGTTTEFAVQFTEPGKAVPTLLPVGEPAYVWETVRELRGRGITGTPVHREVGEWRTHDVLQGSVSRTFAREDVVRIGFQVWEHETEPHGFAGALIELRRFDPELSDHQRADKLLRLVEEINHREYVADVEPGPDETRESLAEDAERRVREAADALIGGA